ncbi:MAG TPA: outer membrane beta-barrel protein [Gemmatimonadaceae bacterium]|nr:outer membrane beta-barrel protein [Gemmatimonadaceae bacterium]
MKKTMLVAAMFLAAASTVQAQSIVKPFSFGVSGGAAIPTGKSGDIATTGFNLTGLSEYHAPGLPVTLRGELSYDRLGIKDLPSDMDGHHSILSGVVSAVRVFGATPTLKPYMIAGAGVYNVKSTVSQGGISVSESRTAPGLNGGMGLNFSLAGMSTFAEARYHYAFTKNVDKGWENTQSIPLVFGFRF